MTVDPSRAVVAVLTTAPDLGSAAAITTRLVEERLILAFPVVAGCERYLAWVADEVKASE
jgi:uncharacterized protein involved in tolerance to divalent cations